MSIRESVDRINQNVANTYAVLGALGADMPSEQNSDNLASTAGTAKAVLYSEQSLTEEQKEQARSNIGAKPEPLVVTFTPINNVFSTPSHSASEIQAAPDAGRSVVAVWPHTDDGITFLLPYVGTGIYNGMSAVLFACPGMDATGMHTTINVILVADAVDGSISQYGSVELATMADIPTYLPNGYSLIINGSSYDGTSRIDFTDTINKMIDKKVPDIPAALPNPNPLTIDGTSYDGSEAVTVYTGGGKSVLAYGAVGDGVADDTAAFQTALAENRVVYVPGGTYVLNDTLVIRENCCLELSQDTVLKFTQTDAHCIQMRGSATLRGNHALIMVPYEFTGNVIDMNTVDDGLIHASIPPYARSSPMFRRQRFVYDVNIIKPIYESDGSPGFCQSKTGDCNGTGIYMSAKKDGDASTTDISFMWAITMSGIRIAGAFNYGIHAINFDSPSDFSGHYEDDAWNHDMRIEAVIEGCEVGVALENCNCAHLDVTIEPAPAKDGTKYAKHGIYLKDSRFVDLMRSRVWDWNATGTLWTSGGQYQHLALIGDCTGLLLDDFLVYEESGDIRNRIYTDTTANFDAMTILQELTPKYLRLKSEKITTEDTDFVHESADVMLLDDSIKIKVENIIGDIGGGAETETVLSDNLLDKSLLTKGQCFYYGGSGYQLAASTYTHYGFIPLRGAGTYRTKFQQGIHEYTGTRIALVNDSNVWVANATGTCGAVVEDKNWVDFEFVVTEAHIAAGVTKVAFDVYELYMGNTMIVKDREYPSEYIPYGYIEVATDSGKKQDNVLCGKTAVFLGDSICAGTTVGTDSPYYNYGWAGLIGEANHMNWTNYGKNGGTITHRGVDGTCIAKIADTAIAEHPTADYVIFEGGCNDADQMREAGLGEISADYATFDTTTFSGALEALILKLVTAYPSAKIGYIIPQKMYTGYADYTAKTHIHRLYFDRAVAICQKWGIPVIDIWNGSMLNPKLSTSSVYYVEENGQHLTEAGYLAITPMIEAWMRNMYVPGTAGGSGGSGGVASWNDLTDKPFDIVELMPETQFVYDESMGFFVAQTDFEFAAGRTYIISWNGVEYTSTARIAPVTIGSDTALTVMVGNPVLAGEDDNGLPFGVATLPFFSSYKGVICAIPFDGSTAASVSIKGGESSALYKSSYEPLVLDGRIENNGNLTVIYGDDTEVMQAFFAGREIVVVAFGTMPARFTATAYIPHSLTGTSTTNGNILVLYGGVTDSLAQFVYNGDGIYVPYSD